MDNYIQSLFITMQAFVRASVAGIETPSLSLFRNVHSTLAEYAVSLTKWDVLNNSSVTNPTGDSFKGSFCAALPIHKYVGGDVSLPASFYGARQGYRSRKVRVGQNGTLSPDLCVVSTHTGNENTPSVVSHIQHPYRTGHKDTKTLICFTASKDPKVRQSVEISLKEQIDDLTKDLSTGFYVVVISGNYSKSRFDHHTIGLKLLVDGYSMVVKPLPVIKPRPILKAKSVAPVVATQKVIAKTKSEAHSKANAQSLAGLGL